MSEKARELSPEEKLWAVKEYLSGKGSTYSIADKYGVTDISIRRWVDRYKIDGEQAFRNVFRGKPFFIHNFLNMNFNHETIILHFPRK